MTDTVTYGTANPCSGAVILCDQAPGLVNTSLNSFDARLLSSSAAVDAGDNAACAATDYRGNLRPLDGNGNGEAICDTGAYELGSASFRLYLPLIARDF